MPVQFQNARVAAHANMIGQKMGRIHNELTGEFLHMSGTSLTRDIGLSWLGYLYQAENIFKVAAEADLELGNFFFYRRSHFVAE
jgi:hypothetical protein